MLKRGYKLDKIDISCCIDTNSIKAKKGDIGFDVYKKIKGIKLSALVDKYGLPLSVFIAPANVHDSRLYLPTISGFKIEKPIGRPITRPKTIIGDASFDTEEIRDHNLKRKIKTVIPVNPRNRKNKKIGRPRQFDKEIYKRISAVERFNSWIEANKKVYTRYEHLEISYLGLIQLSCAMIWRVLGWVP